MQVYSQTACVFGKDKLIAVFYPSGTSHGKVLYKTPKNNEYFGENFRLFDALDFVAELTAHIPPKGKQYNIRGYGLYSSHNHGLWERMGCCIRFAPQGWKEKHLDNPADAEQIPDEIPECSAEEKTQKSAWARLIKKSMELT